MPIYDPNDPRDLLEMERINESCRKRGKKVKHEEYSPPRSLRQNAYYWLLIEYFGSQQGYTKYESEDIFKREANASLFVTEYTDKHGMTRERVRSSTELSKVEMSSAIRNFKAYAAMNGIDLPESNDFAFINYCKREIENNKLYL